MVEGGGEVVHDDGLEERTHPVLAHVLLLLHLLPGDDEREGVVLFQQSLGAHLLGLLGGCLLVVGHQSPHCALHLGLVELVLLHVHSTNTHKKKKPNVLPFPIFTRY